MGDSKMLGEWDFYVAKTRINQAICVTFMVNLGMVYALTTLLLVA